MDETDQNSEHLEQSISTSKLLDVSDVSWLFPLDKQGLRPDLSLSPPISGKAFLDEPDFRAILATATLTGIGKAPKT